MAHIIQKVTLNHLKMNSTDYLNNIITLFYCFLKKNYVFRNLYSKDNEKYITTHLTRKELYRRLDIYPILRNRRLDKISDLWLDYGSELASGDLGFPYSSPSILSLSQLWRFYLLDNMDNIIFPEEEEKESLIEKLRRAIEANGLRGSKEIEEYFKKYDIPNNGIK